MISKSKVSMKHMNILVFVKVNIVIFLSNDHTTLPQIMLIVELGMVTKL